MNPTRLLRCVALIAILSCSSEGLVAGTPVEAASESPGDTGSEPAVEGERVAEAPGGQKAGKARGKRSSKPRSGKAAQGKPAAFTPDMAELYFQKGPAGQAAERFALEDWQAARDGFSRYLRQQGRRMDRAAVGRVRLLMALADARLGKWVRAAEGFEFAASRLPLITDYIFYQAARARYFARQTVPAMAHARKVSRDSIAGADAALLIGDMLRGNKDFAAMAAHYAAYIDGRDKAIRLSEARYRLAQAYEQTGKTTEAIGLYRRVLIAAPLSGWATKSQKRFDKLLENLDPRSRARHKAFTADELIERGMAYYGAMRNPLSEADFAAALKAPGLTAESRCVAAYHRANSVFKDRDRKRAAPLFDKAIAACSKAGGSERAIDLTVKGAYQAGRAYAFIGKHETAIKRYKKAETVSPTHTYRDDARLRRAEEHTDLGQETKVAEVLASIPEAYPDGDMRAEATWRLGWQAYRAGKYKEAIGWFRKQIEIMPIDTNYWAEGQAQYWMGRAHARLKQPAKAVAAYREAVMRYPLSYYALLALNRLRQQHRAAFGKTLKAIRSVPGDAGERAAPLRFAPRPEYGTKGFARALEFLRLGLGEQAEAEIRRLGLSIPAGKREVSDPDVRERIWAVAFLYHRARRYSHSHWPTRWHVLGYKRLWPVAGNKERWQIAYPRGFWKLLGKHAREQGFPVELIAAIVREESAFDPLRESYANAIGLTQMIFPTARRFGKDTGIEITRANLRDPDKNVTIGSRFLAFLWQKWRRRALLVPPSYNAGENAVARWLRDRGDLPADEFLETIKADQPRRYSKRVMSSYFTYSYLYRGVIPKVSFRSPDELLSAPKKKKKARK